MRQAHNEIWIEPEEEIIKLENKIDKNDINKKKNKYEHIKDD